MSAYPTLEERRKLTAQPCTLDGKPAVLRGACLDYAVVAAFPVGPRVEYAWQTAARVMAESAAFKS